MLRDVAQAGNPVIRPSRAHAKANVVLLGSRHNDWLTGLFDPTRNSLNLLRLCAVLAVIASHSFTIPVGLQGIEPLAAATPFSLGQYAVNLFFVVSGLTLTGSIDRNPDLLRYAWARVLRIFPPLFVFGMIFAFFAGPLLTTWRLADYFSDIRTWTYPAALLVQFSKAAAPPSIFDALPVAGEVNDPLWTVKYEIAAYVCLAVLLGIGLLRRKPILPVLVLVSFIAFEISSLLRDRLALGVPVYQMGRYGFCFLLGIMAFHFRHRMSAPVLLVLPVAAILAARGPALEPAAYIVLTAHLVMILGALDVGRVSRSCREHDLSYGIHIYGWPIQQALTATVPGLGSYELMALSFLIVPALALLSSHYVEKPALGLKRIDPRALFARA